MLLNTNPDIVVNPQQQQSSPHPGNLLLACQGHLDPDGGGHVVVLHPDHDLLLHRQPGSLPHRREDGVPHRVGRGPRQADQDQVRLPGVGIHAGILQGEYGKVDSGGTLILSTSHIHDT